MTTVKVNVRWTKEKFDVDVNKDEAPLMFKAQLFALTGVEPSRQKVIFKGKLLGDEAWDNFDDLNNGSQLMMMGSADVLPQKPVEKPVFMEDMDSAQYNRILKMPAGLKNLGNTCYMNATLQCLKVVPELTVALKAFNASIMRSLDTDGGSALTAATRDLFSIMDSTGESEIPPIIMLQVVHKVLPQFSERDEHGSFRQQDANEFWLEILRAMQNKLRGADNTNVVTKNFGGTFEVTFKCKEDETEPATTSKEDFLQLSCFLSQEVKYLANGLKAKMTEDILKRSPTLNRDAHYEKQNRICRLPSFLTVQMVRFSFKEKEQINAKILKDVKFPIILDIYDLCSESLQQKLRPNRELIKLQDDKAAQKHKMAKIAKFDGKKEDAVKEQCHTDPVKYLPTSFEDDPGSNNSAIYELKAVLTHKGRSSSSGHYVAWVRRDAKVWLKCDDDDVTALHEEDVLKLSGGGDWHCAYLLLYGPKMTEAPLEDAK